jgi:hypothetical protein
MYEVFPRVFFGGAGVTHSPKAMLRAGITHVVNCESSYASTSYAGRSMNFLFLRPYDDEDWPILDTHFDALRAYVDAALASDPSANVLIHCYMGWNRSAALAIAYACARTGRPAAQLIEEVRAATTAPILMNEGFIAQLCARFPSGITRRLPSPAPYPEYVAGAQFGPP